MFSKNNQPKKRSVRPKGAANVFDEGVKRTQAGLMLAKRIQGASIDSLAKEFNVSDNTVRRRIDYAQRHNLLADATDRVLSEMVGPAHQAYLNALASDDERVALEAARDVMFGTGILSRQNKAQVAPVQAVEMTLAMWREQRSKGYDEAVEAAVTPESLDGRTSPGDAALPGEILDPDPGSDDLPPARPQEWPPLPPAPLPPEDDEEDQ